MTTFATMEAASGLTTSGAVQTMKYMKKLGRQKKSSMSSRKEMGAGLTSRQATM